MTDAQRRFGDRRSPAAVELSVAAQVENLAMLRTLVGAVGTFSDLDFDAVADLRLAVDEACTAADDVVSPGSFSWHVLKSLTDDVQASHDGQRAGITLTTRRAGTER